MCQKKVGSKVKQKKSKDRINNIGTKSKKQTLTVVFDIYGANQWPEQNKIKIKKLKGENKIDTSNMKRVNKNKKKYNTFPKTYLDDTSLTS